MGKLSLCLSTMSQMYIDHTNRGEVPRVLTSTHSATVQCRSGFGLAVQNIEAWHKIMCD